MEVTARVEFHEKGFTPGKDVSELEMEKLRDQFMQMYNFWATNTNTIQDKINDLWEKYERILKSGDDIAIYLCEKTMDIKKGMDYYDWCEKWYKEVAQGVDLVFIGSRLKSRIFRDGELPIYGVEFKDHPDWTIDFTLKIL